MNLKRRVNRYLTIYTCIMDVGLEAPETVVGGTLLDPKVEGRCEMTRKDGRNVQCWMRDKMSRARDRNRCRSMSRNVQGNRNRRGGERVERMLREMVNGSLPNFHSLRS